MYTKLKKRMYISAFGYKNKGKHPIYVSKQCSEEKCVDLLLIGEEGKKHFIKDFNTFMYNHIYIAEENIFTVNVYMLSVQNKY